MQEHLLTYALNSNGELVNVDDVATGLSCGCKCPCCHENLVAKNGGTKRNHHFAHASGSDCKGHYETMLHLLAKKRIRETFDKQSFKLGYQLFGKEVCANSECKLRDNEHCERPAYLLEIHLNDYYDKCEEEKPYPDTDYIADLLISNSANKYKPIGIEIFVSHECTEEKINSGLPIIELKVESEDDIEQYCSKLWKENKLRNFPESNNIVFYNFKRNPIQNTDFKKEIGDRFVLYPSGKFYIHKTNCKNLDKESNKTSIIELDITDVNPNVGSRLFAICYLKKFGIYIRNCMLCKYNDRSICNLSHKFGTPINPELQYAQQCSLYRQKSENKFFQDLKVYGIKTLPEITCRKWNTEAVDIYKKQQAEIEEKMREHSKEMNARHKEAEEKSVVSGLFDFIQNSESFNKTNQTQSYSDAQINHQEITQPQIVDRKLNSCLDCLHCISYRSSDTSSCCGKHAPNEPRIYVNPNKAIDCKDFKEYM